MKKLLIVLFASFLFLFGTSCISIWLNAFDFDNYWIPLAIGCSIILVSIALIVIYQKIKIQLFLYLVFVINFIAMGFLIKTWHLFRGYNLDLYVLILISLGCVGYLVIFYVLSYIPIFSKHFKSYLLTFLVVSIVAYIILIIVTKTSYLSTFGYYMIIEIGFLLALSVYTENINDLIKSISLSTFLVIIVAIIIIMLMLDGSPDVYDADANLDLISPKEQSRIRTIKL